MTLAELRFIASMIVTKTSLDDKTVLAVVEDAVAKTRLLEAYVAADNEPSPARVRRYGVPCDCGRCVEARRLLA